MAKPGSDNYVTTRELAAELRSMRWEMRFLIATAALVNLGIGYKLNVPGVTEAVGFVIHAL